MVFLSAAGLSFATGEQAVAGKRRVSLPDVIRMTRLADPSYFLGASVKGHVAQFSPDGKRFVIVVKKGNLEKNTNEYSVLLFETSEAFRSPKPQRLVTMSSSSNRDGILNVRWLSDGATITFIGESPNKLPQVYSFNIKSKKLTQLTRQATPVIAYDLSSLTMNLVFKTRASRETSTNARLTPRGAVVINGQELIDILSNRKSSFSEAAEVFFQEKGKRAKDISVPDVILQHGALSISPNGRYVLFEVKVRDVAPSWNEYRDESDEFFNQLIAQKPRNGRATRISEYMLFDSVTGRCVPLIGTPAGRGSGFAWSPDSKSVALSGAYLPLDIMDPVELEERKKRTYIVEAQLPSRKAVKICDKKDMIVETWNPTTNTITLHSYTAAENLELHYKKDLTVWRQISARTPEDSNASDSMVVSLEESLDTPPRIFVSRNGESKLLLDLNPHFKEVNFSKVEVVTWKTRDGHELKGGLYLPPTLVRGERYPLVIQTHGFWSDRFSMDGSPEWSTAFAARVLAGRGFLVVQTYDYTDKKQDRLEHSETPLEGPNAAAVYEGLIDELDSRGMIDVNRVGIIGFSRTTYHVAYTLTHSKYRFAAAVLAEGIDGGYFQYIAFPAMAPDSFLINGGPPFGEKLSLWLKNSPGFNLDKVKTPVRLEAFSYDAVLMQWEWFSGLSALMKPVDFVYFPDATHLVVKPWDRMAAQQGLADWFSFWLKGEEDQDPAKVSQYIRWREMRNQVTPNDR